MAPEHLGVGVCLIAASENEATEIVADVTTTDYSEKQSPPFPHRTAETEREQTEQATTIKYLKYLSF
jgi:hypothetical protein